MQFSARQPSNAVIYACHADLAEASHRYHLSNTERRWEHEREQHADAAAARLPHEHAAARVLNVWGHLHPVECRAVEVAERYVAQRKAGWADRAAGSFADLKFYLTERAKLRRAFDSAVADYQAACAAVDVRLAA
jgi:hypothetical protein